MKTTIFIEKNNFEGTEMTTMTSNWPYCFDPLFDFIAYVYFREIFFGFLDKFFQRKTDFIVKISN